MGGRTEMISVGRDQEVGPGGRTGGEAGLGRGPRAACATGTSTMELVCVILGLKVVRVVLGRGSLSCPMYCGGLRRMLTNQVQELPRP